MEIERINTYSDKRFSKNALYQHGCFLLDQKPYEVEIVSDFEAIVRGENKSEYHNIIDEFRFFAPHITEFLDEDCNIVKEFAHAEPFTVLLEEIQPSQFYVDEEKVAAISTFIQKPEDIIIQVLPFNERYISLDGHTRLYYAFLKGFEYVRAVIESSDDYIYAFTAEAQKRGIYTPKDMVLLRHDEYEEKWNRFCDKFFEASANSADSGDENNNEQ